MKLFITKYALSCGIEEVEGIISEHFPTMCSYQTPGGYVNHAHRNDWHTCKKNATAMAEEMRDKKIASLRKQIKKLEGLKF